MPRRRGGDARQEGGEDYTGAVTDASRSLMSADARRLDEVSGPADSKWGWIVFRPQTKKTATVASD